MPKRKFNLVLLIVNLDDVFITDDLQDVSNLHKQLM